VTSAAVVGCTAADYCCVRIFRVAPRASADRAHGGDDRLLARSAAEPAREARHSPAARAGLTPATSAPRLIRRATSPRGTAILSGSRCWAVPAWRAHVPSRQASAVQHRCIVAFFIVALLHATLLHCMVASSHRHIVACHARCNGPCLRTTSCGLPTSRSPPRSSRALRRTCRRSSPVRPHICAGTASARTSAHRCAAGAGPPLCVRTACGAGATLAGLNARWRLYRYVPGAHHRPHVDGAWPGRSGTAPAAWATGARATTHRVSSQRRNA
jgi:hypothetical protein